MFKRSGSNVAEASVSDLQQALARLDTSAQMHADQARRFEAREQELLTQLDDAVLMEAPAARLTKLRADLADAREACAREREAAHQDRAQADRLRPRVESLERDQYAAERRQALREAEPIVREMEARLRELSALNTQLRELWEAGHLNLPGFPAPWPDLELRQSASLLWYWLRDADTFDFKAAAAPAPAHREG